MVLGNPVQIQFYVSREEKKAFVDACYYGDTTMSRELRRFVRELIANPPEDTRLYHQNHQQPGESE
jgi:hypothetical protein